MSQCDQLLAVLADGEWHTTHELLREVPCSVHSRISDLRGRGLEIEHDTVGAGASGSRYRLVKTDAEPQRRPGVCHPPVDVTAAVTNGERPPVLTCPAPANGASASTVPGHAAYPPVAGHQLSFEAA